MKTLLAICLLMLAACAHQRPTPTPREGELPVGTPPYSAEISFAPPTHYADDPLTSEDEGVPIPSDVVLTYNVYQGAQGSPKSIVATITTSGTTIDTGINAGIFCWEVTSVADGVESKRSNEACKQFLSTAPGKVTITVT